MAIRKGPSLLRKMGGVLLQPLQRVSKTPIQKVHVSPTWKGFKKVSKGFRTGSYKANRQGPYFAKPENFQKRQIGRSSFRQSGRISKGFWTGSYCTTREGYFFHRSGKFSNTSIWKGPHFVNQEGFLKGFRRVPITRIGRVLISLNQKIFKNAKLEGPLFANQEGFLKGFGRVPIAQIGKGIYFAKAESFQTRQFGRVLISSIRKDF